MKIVLTYFDGKDVQIEEIENTKPPVSAAGGLFLQFLDEFTGQPKFMLLTSRVVRMDFEESQVKGVTLQ